MSVRKRNEPRRFRIALGQISSESNHFVRDPCDQDFFRATGYICEGTEVLGLQDSDTEVGGMLEACGAENVDVVPLLAARGNSSGPLSRASYDGMKRSMLKRLREAVPVDGVLLSHHGSMAVEDEDDPEGDMAAEIRAIVGSATPIMMTLDLHGNVTRRMVEATNAILGYETYPHRDSRETGKRAARLLLRTLRGEVKPAMVHVKMPMLLTGFLGSTEGEGPYARLMRRAKEIEREPGVLSVSVFLVGSYLDMTDIGCSTVVVTNDDAPLAEKRAGELARDFFATRADFVPPVVSVSEAVRQGRGIEGGPVLLLDTADTTGGGAAGDSIAAVRGLLEAGVTEPCLAMVVDPQAASRAHEAAVGDSLTVEVGHRLDPKWGRPLRLTGRVTAKLDGRFQYSGGILGGRWASMGPSAVIESGPLRLLVMSLPTYDWKCEQYESAGLDPQAAKFVVVKNMMNFRQGYGGFMKGVFVLDCPGPTPPDMRLLKFRRIRRPMYPMDEITMENRELNRGSRSPSPPAPTSGNPQT